MPATAILPSAAVSEAGAASTAWPASSGARALSSEVKPLRLSRRRSAPTARLRRWETAGWLMPSSPAISSCVRCSR